MADQMGLGKTLQMIALVASDIGRPKLKNSLVRKSTELSSTLIVVPFPCELYQLLRLCFANDL
jgi:SNF2 family DNA or RNA helicase